MLHDCKLLYITLIGPPNEPGSLQGENTLVWAPGQKVRQDEEMPIGEALSPAGRECVQNPQIYSVVSAELHITKGAK